MQIPITQSRMTKLDYVMQYIQCSNTPMIQKSQMLLTSRYTTIWKQLYKTRTSILCSAPPDVYHLLVERGEGWGYATCAAHLPNGKPTPSWTNQPILSLKPHFYTSNCKRLYVITIKIMIFCLNKNFRCLIYSSIIISCMVKLKTLSGDFIREVVSKFFLMPPIFYNFIPKTKKIAIAFARAQFLKVREPWAHLMFWEFSNHTSLASGAGSGIQHACVCERVQRPSKRIANCVQVGLQTRKPRARGGAPPFPRTHIFTQGFC